MDKEVADAIAAYSTLIGKIAKGRIPEVLDAGHWVEYAKGEIPTFNMFRAGYVRLQPSKAEVGPFFLVRKGNNVLLIRTSETAGAIENGFFLVSRSDISFDGDSLTISYQTEED